MTEQIITVKIPNDYSDLLDRHTYNTSARHLCLTGGIRAIFFSDDLLVIEPILENNKVYIKGPLTKNNFSKLIRECNLNIIAIEEIQLYQGKCFEIWTPYIEGKKNNSITPANWWSNAAYHFAIKRLEEDNNKTINVKNVEEKNKEEELCRSIYLSLKCIDMTVKHIYAFYNRKLIDFLSTGRADGKIETDISDQDLPPYIHSFFMHFGSCRDHLAGLIALRLKLPSRLPNRIVDDMTRLLTNITIDDFDAEPMLSFLLSNGLIDNKNPKKRTTSGWMKDASELRKRFVHHEPYGLHTNEGKGQIVPISKETGLYKFIYLISTSDTQQCDTLDIIVYYYKKILNLFEKMIELSNYDFSIPSITDEDIIKTVNIRS